jgi:hypothetical protein
MTKFLNKAIFLIFSGIILSCNAPRKALLNGNYDLAYEKSFNKLRQTNKKDKHILTFESAYNKALQRDLERIKQLKLEGQPDRFIEINRIYQSISARQIKAKIVQPLIIKSEKRNADIKEIDVIGLMAESKEKAAAFLYAEAENLLKNNNKFEARKAYDNLKLIKSYFNYYKETDKLLDEAHFKGTSFVYYTLKNNSPIQLPETFIEDLTEKNINNLNTFWIQYHTNKNINIKYDYEVITRIDDILISGNELNERQYNETKSIEDGWEYVLDSRGNVMKDSLGNDIKQPKIVKVNCNIRESRQFKTIRIAGKVQYFNQTTAQLEGSFPVMADHSFENYYANAFGDLRALKPETKKLINAKPLPYPDNVSMIIACGQTYKNTVNKLLSDNAQLIR